MGKNSKNLHVDVCRCIPSARVQPRWQWHLKFLLLCPKFTGLGFVSAAPRCWSHCVWGAPKNNDNLSIVLSLGHDHGCPTYHALCSGQVQVTLAHCTTLWPSNWRSVNGAQQISHSSTRACSSCAAKSAGVHSKSLLSGLLVFKADSAAQEATAQLHHDSTALDLRPKSPV